MKTKSVMIVGVGGQGSLLASRILGHVFLEQGFDVKVSEVHGMSQRGGSVVTYIKYGDQVFSPIIEQGEADFLLSFEQLEAARWLPYLKKGGTMILSTQKIDPMPVIIGAAQYPEIIVSKLRQTGANLVAVDALNLAQQAGSPKATNTVLIGILSTMMPFAKENWEAAIRELVPQKFLDLNLKAFELGRMAAAADVEMR